MPDAQPPSNAPDLETTTIYANAPGTAAREFSEEWALIRYVGHPFGEVLYVQGTMEMGRASDCDVCLPESDVSRRHARLELADGTDGRQVVRLADLGSSNGTFVNGIRVKSQQVVTLRNGDVLRVGSHAFKLKCLDPLERNYHEAVLAQTTIDPLTSVCNRSTILAYLDKSTGLAKRHNRLLSVVLCDLDHFKRVNDNYGHQAGDLVLEAFGGTLSKRLRSSDYAGRIGGEEFLIVLPETAGQEAVKLAENLRIGGFSVQLAGQPLNVTCSMGVAQLRPGDEDGGSMLARADAALYRAKALGRDRVELESTP